MLLSFSIASVNKRADLVKTNLTLIVLVHRWCLPCWVSLQELVSDISGWELAVFDFSPWQLARRVCQDLVVSGCKSHRGELRNCTHQPMLENKITVLKKFIVHLSSLSMAAKRFKFDISVLATLRLFMSNLVRHVGMVPRCWPIEKSSLALQWGILKAEDLGSTLLKKSKFTFSY